jgi:hypothetical protein
LGIGLNIQCLQDAGVAAAHRCSTLRKYICNRGWSNATETILPLSARMTDSALDWQAPKTTVNYANNLCAYRDENSIAAPGSIGLPKIDRFVTRLSKTGAISCLSREENLVI